MDDGLPIEFHLLSETDARFAIEQAVEGLLQTIASVTFHVAAYTVYDTECVGWENTADGRGSHTTLAIGTLAVGAVFAEHADVVAVLRKERSLVAELLVFEVGDSTQGEVATVAFAISLHHAEGMFGSSLSRVEFVHPLCRRTVGTEIILHRVLGQ